MRLRVVAVGQRMPTWVSDAWTEYTRRMPKNLPVELREIPLADRSGARPGRDADARRLCDAEGEAMLAALTSRSRRIALDVKGRGWSTEDLSEQMARWMEEGQDVEFMIGGPDGLSNDCLEGAHQRWSLGPLTLPHPLVRVVLAEQIYRAWTILQNHPYHRA